MELKTSFIQSQREKVLIETGKQKTLTSSPLKTNEDVNINMKYCSKLPISKVIYSNNEMFEAVMDTYTITCEQYNTILKISKQIYGNDISLFFNAESKWNISFGVKKRK